MTRLSQADIDRLDREWPARDSRSHLSPDGEPIGLGTWAAYIEDPDVKIVRQEHIRREPDTFVSTVYLGLDHGWGDGPPLIYETMIFGGPNDQWQDRYTTREQAVKGHRRARRHAWPWLDRFVLEPLRNLRPVL